MRIFVAMSGDIVFARHFLSSSIFPVLFPFNGGNGVYSVVECHKYVLFLLKWNFSPYVDSNMRYIKTFENRSDTLHMRYTGIRIRWDNQVDISFESKRQGIRWNYQVGLTFRSKTKVSGETVW